MEDDRKPSADFSTRLKHARKFRDNVKNDIREILFFTCPGRESDFDKTYDNPADENTEEETFSSISEDLASDFASDLVTYYTPSEAIWTEYFVTAPVDEDVADAVEEIVTAREQELFEMVQSSNYNDVAPQVAFEANHGTMAMWVERSSLSQPIFCETVPPHELLITPGHQGWLDRFREKMVPSNTLKALFKDWDVDLNEITIQNKMKKPDQYSKVCWGFWADWSDPESPKWKYEITVDGKRITPKEPEILGPIAGSCPADGRPVQPAGWKAVGQGARVESPAGSSRLRCREGRRARRSGSGVAKHADLCG